MLHNFSRIAIVTGASSGIGEATVKSFVSAGIGVVGNGRNEAKLKQLQHDLGSAFIGLPGDASDPRVLDQLFESAISHFGIPADLVVANAGRGLGGTVKDADLSEFDDLFKINITGTLTLLQKASQNIIESHKNKFPEKAADIIVIGSVVGRHISPFSSVYGATKAAVHSLTEGLRRDVGPKGIRVTLIEPGFVVSRFQERALYTDDMVQGFHDKFGPLLTGEDVADAILFAVTRPPHVHIGDIVIRPTRQDYP